MIKIFVALNNETQSIVIPDGTSWNPYDENGIVIYNEDRQIVAAFNFDNIIGLYVEGDFKKQTEIRKLYPEIKELYPYEI